MTTTPSLTSYDNIQKIDQQTALSICSLAGIKTHDSLGNIMPHVWCSRADTVKKTDLVNANDIRNLLLTQVKQELAAKKDLILELDQASDVIEWVVNFTKVWEQEYQQKRQQQHDIAEFVYSAMQEAIHHLEIWIDQVFPDVLPVLKEKIARQKENNPNSFILSHQCLVRLLFRLDEIQPTLTRYTATVLQQREVCSKPGVYSATKQFNNIQQQRERAFYECIAVLEDKIEMVGMLSETAVYQNITDVADLRRATS